MENPVLLEQDNGIAIITLNRPQKRNAINQEMLIHLYNILDKISRKAEIKVVILTGSGKSFCSGLDLAAIETDNLFDPRGDGRDFPDIIGDFSKPIIGAINGHAITGGLEMALNLDFLIAADQAIFADTHVKMGIHPGWGMSQLLQEAIGQRMAKQLSLTGQFINAEEALRLGLINEVVPLNELMPRVKQIATAILKTKSEMAPLLLDLIKSRNNTTLKEALSNERLEFRRFVVNSHLVH